MSTPLNFDVEFQAALDARVVPEAETYSNCMNSSEQHKLVYQIEAVHPRLCVDSQGKPRGLDVEPSQRTSQRNSPAHVQGS